MLTAFVVLSKEHTPVDQTIDEIRREIQEYVDNRVYDERRLRGGVRVVDFLPRTAFGKLKRHEVLQLYLEKTT